MTDDNATTDEEPTVESELDHEHGGTVETSRDASEAADKGLEQQRAEHEPRSDLPHHDVNDAGVGPLVNNTGMDGEAASG